ncbi:MAG TPA: ABC transporter substrate-binding protein, partial [Kaistiaceae bacterium]|nr:ABC transporter substrate-binding protein [Kaistiaceae bacterium]
AAMQAGTIDAAEWVGPYDDLAFGLYKVAKYYYMPAFHELGAGLEVTVNKAAWDGLPDDLKAIVRNAAMASAAQSIADFTFHNIESLQPLLDKEGVELKSLNDDIVMALAKEADAVLAEISTASPLAKEVYDSFVAYRAKANSYAKVSELGALAMREKALG